MCLSASVSFMLGCTLLAGGAASIVKVEKTDKRYRAMALFPFFVGIQQMTEGVVWLGLDHGDRFVSEAAAFFYLFFVWFIWPFWVPLISFSVESNRNKKQLLGVFAAIGFLWGLLLYAPYLLHPEWLGNIHVVQNSILYDTELFLDAYIPRPVTYMIYLALIGFPLLLSSYVHMNIFGLALLFAVPLTYFFFIYAHISLLCFLAALISLYIINIIWRDLCREDGDAEAP